MYDYRIVEQVSRKKKHMSGALRKVMVIFAVLFVLMGITISQAFMLPGFLLALLYLCPAVSLPAAPACGLPSVCR